MKRLFVCLFVCLFVAPCLVNVANADLVIGDLVFKNVDEKDSKVSQYREDFQFIFSQTDSGADIVFALTDSGIRKGLHLGDQGVKFKDFKADWLNDFFVSIPKTANNNGDWSNDGWTNYDTQASFDLTFKDGIDWDVFAAAAEERVLEIHIQSLTVSTGGNSINGAKFIYKYTYDGKEGAEGGATPEPATMLIFGLGIAGLGLCRRMRKV